MESSKWLYAKREKQQRVLLRTNDEYIITYFVMTQYYTFQ
jgi:hypothetical protein